MMGMQIFLILFPILQHQLYFNNPPAYDATASPRRYERKKRKRDAECRFLAPVPPNGVPRDPRRRPRKRTKTN